MLYAKADDVNKRLMYTCRNCDFKMVAASNCIYVNKVMGTVECVCQLVSHKH